MTNPLTFSSFTTQLATLAVVDPTDTNFLTILPQAISYAELRLYRDVDFLSTTVANTTYNLTAGSRTLSIPASVFWTIQDVNVITPAGQTMPDAGQRNPLLPTSKEYLDNVWGSVSNAQLPQNYAMLDQSTFRVGPWPDTNYTVEIIGTIRPRSLGQALPTITTAAGSSNIGTLTFQSNHLMLSGDQITLTGFTASNWNGTWGVTVISPTTLTVSISGIADAVAIGSATVGATFISTYLPDIMIMASMIYVSNYQRDFSSAGNDPQMPINYEQQYQTLVKGAQLDEARKAFQAAAWTSEPPATSASPTRG